MKGSEDTKQEWLENSGGVHRPARRGSFRREESTVLGFLGLVSLVLNSKRGIPNRNRESSTYLHCHRDATVAVPCFFSSREDEAASRPPIPAGFVLALPMGPSLDTLVFISRCVLPSSLSIFGADFSLAFLHPPAYSPVL